MLLDLFVGGSLEIACQKIDKFMLHILQVKYLIIINLIVAINFLSFNYH